MSARWWTFGIWALVAASLVYWGLKLLSPGLPVPANTLLAQPGDGLKGDLARVWGADTPAPVVAAAAPQAVEDTRFTLIGVLSPRQPGRANVGVALIAVDGKPAKAYRVGAVVEGDKVLQTVSLRSATLGPRGGAALVSLKIAPPSEAARGTPGADGVAAAAGLPGAAGTPTNAVGMDGAGSLPGGQMTRLPPGFPAAPGSLPPQMSPQPGMSAPGTPLGVAPPLPSPPGSVPPNTAAAAKVPPSARQGAVLRSAPAYNPATPSGQNQR